MKRPVPIFTIYPKDDIKRVVKEIISDNDNKSSKSEESKQSNKEPEADGFDVDKITDQQTLRSAFNRLSLEMTKLLKGAISEKELKIASNATANFGNTAEANRMILLTQRAAAVKARLVESEMLNYKDAIGNLGRGTYNGKEYNSFTQFKREFVNQDKEFIVKQVVPEINSIAEMNALVKISGGLDNLTDETVALMDERLAQF